MKKTFQFIALILISYLSNAQQAEPADGILNTAYQKASVEHKNLFVIFGTSSCGWCRRMSKSMNDDSIKNYFNDNYIIVHLSVFEVAEKKYLENPGAEDLLRKYKGEKAGTPFYVILDSTGNLLGDSFLNGTNLSCPSEDHEVEAFIRLLKKTSNISEEGYRAIAIRFKKNKT